LDKWLDLFKNEVMLIKDAPRVSLIAFVLLSGLSYWIQTRFVYGEVIANKDVVIADLKKQIEDLRNQKTQPPQSTSNVTASGPGSIANTGAGSTFNTDPALKPGTRK